MRSEILMESDDELITAAELAQLLRVQESTVRTYLHSKNPAARARIPTPVYFRGHPRWRRGDVIKFLSIEQ